MTGIAIIGMGCRLPGADTPDTFWRNLCAGVDSVSCFTDEELLAAGVSPALLAHPAYVKAGAVLADADKFDAGFFGFSPREAALLDPQQRLLLEVAWEAFEDAGYHPESYDGVAGVFAGGGGVVTSYLFAHAGHPAFDAPTASLPHLGNDKDFLATRVSYKLDLTGPSLTVQTACSTSLVAVHLACQSLNSDECDVALAGATTVRIPQIAGYLAEKGNVYSLDGRCRAFDASGQGTIFGSGVAAVLLKKVEGALADGDHIYAVITGTAINNDGGRKVSYPSPSVTGQARAMVEAFTMADCSPETVRYIECHATGTTVGDPQEIHALTRAFREWTTRSGFCAVGSVKTNVGHPEQAAGLVGLMKAALALRHRRIPPSLHYVTPNPKIDFEASPFFVNTELRDWPPDGHPRRAGVNSLGIGGTNAFVVLEEAPVENAAGAGTEPAAPAGPHVLALSAKSETALTAYIDRVRGFLEAEPGIDLADLAYTSNVSRSQLPFRFAVTAASVDDLRSRLAAMSSGSMATPIVNARGAEPRIAMLFSGQGSQYPGMAVELYRRHAVFRDALERCAAVLRGHLDQPLLDILSADGQPGASLAETRYAQPALVAVELALAEMWRAWGVRPAAVLGHSVGEFAAASVAGIIDQEETLQLVAERARLMQELPKDGAMVAVLAPEAVVEQALRTASGPATIAAVNGPAATVVSGAREAVQRVVASLQASGYVTRPLRVSHAFHSPLIDPMLDEFEQAAQRVTARHPEIPLVSNVTGKVLDTIPDSRYWRTHARQRVRFADGLRALQELGIGIFIEIGPGGTLIGLGRQVLGAAPATWLTTLQRAGAESSDMATALASLYLEGVAIDWRQVHRGASRCRVSMPTYPFERKRYWLEPVESAAAPRAPDTGRTLATPHPLLDHLEPSDGTLRVESVWSTERLPYLRDHRIAGAVILPTAVAAEAVLGAARTHFATHTVAISGLVYHEVMRFKEGEGRRIRVTLTSVAHDRANFSLASLSGGAWRTHVTGLVDTRPDATVVAAEPVPRAPCPHSITPERFYASLRSLGLDYGPAFRGVCELRRGRHAAVGRVRLPTGLTPAAYHIHPAFLDACLHVFPAVLGRNGNAGRRGKVTYLPVGIERLRIHRAGAVEGTVSVVLRDGAAEAGGPVVDIRVDDDERRRIATIEGLSLRALRPAALSAADSVAAAPGLYHVGWEVRTPAASGGSARRPPGAWLVFVGTDAVGERLAAELRRRGEHAYVVSIGRSFSRGPGPAWTIDPRRPGDFRRLLDDVERGEPRPLRGSAFLWALDGSASTALTVAQLERANAHGARAALFLAQALIDARSANRPVGQLWLITRNAQLVAQDAVTVSPPPSLLWGLGRTVALEAPAIWGGLLDLPRTHQGREADDIATLADELLDPDAETQTALRDGVRYVARLRRLGDEPPSSRGLRFRSDATYLITGGLGMLGLSTARRLVSVHGVRSLALVGRRQPTRAAARELAALRAYGARVRVIRGDVACEADVRRILGVLRRLPPLRGVFHGAGVLDDAVLSRMTGEQFDRVIAAKVTGSWLLHHHTRTSSLDFFVLHSSLLSVTGSAGQANYAAANAFLDALVDHRRGQGLPATAINWGPWAVAGMARSTGARGEALWKARGVRYLIPDLALQALDSVLRGGLAHAVVADIDWPVFVAQLPAAAAPFYADVHSATLNAVAGTARAGDDIISRLRTADPDARRTIVREVVRHHVMTELGFVDPIDTRQPLNELGLDSLMSVNVANRLEASLGMPVPVVTLIRGLSVERLVDSLITELDGKGPANATRAVTESPREATAAAVTSAVVGDGWLVIPRPRPSAALRLICFPFAGAGATPYRPWVDVLHPSIELVAVEPPGRASRIHEPPEDDLERFFARLIAALEPMLDRPVAFFGHCLGGLTGWETARRLRQRGRVDLRVFFAAGVRPPHRLSREGHFEHTLLERLLRHENFDPLRPAHEQPDDVFAEITRHFNIGATDEFLAKPELRRLLLPTVRADFALTAAYHYQPEPPWDVPITYFAGLDDPYVSREDASAWSEHTRRSFRLYWRPGAHFLVVDDKNFIVETLNRELTA